MSHKVNNSLYIYNTDISVFYLEYNILNTIKLCIVIELVVEEVVKTQY